MQWPSLTPPRWEVDPFFLAAEEVQDSADRLESVYRTWIHAKSVTVVADENAAIEFYRRELSTALGTAKWQLEEFERAISYTVADDQQCSGDDAPARHKQFVDALRSQISPIEKALLSSEDSRDLKALPVVNLGQEEKDDLALFLCGSRACSHDDPKKTVFCVSTTLGDGKIDEEAPCTTSESVKSRNGMSDCFSTSVSISDTVTSKIDSLKSNACCRLHELSGSDKQFIDCHGNSFADFLEIRIDQSSKPYFDPASEHFFSDGSENYAERANGHHRTVSVGSSLSSWKSGSVSDDSNKRWKNGLVESSSSSLNFWSLFTKKQRALEPRISKSGIKRWKDGDANASDQTQMLKLMHGASNVGKGTGNLCLGGNFNCHALGGCASGDCEHYKTCGETFKMVPCSQCTLLFSRPVQITSAILVALGLVGLLSFHVAASAL